MFKYSEQSKDVICSRDYAERVVASFSHKIQSDYYGGNIYVSIERNTLEHFSALSKTGMNASTESFPLHTLFHFFFSDGSKQYATNITAHSKRFIVLIKLKSIDIIIMYNMGKY